MNKNEYREHCKKQIERCIKLNDTKHLREHELSLSLLNECEERKQEKDSLIKYLEDKIKEFVSYNLLYDSKQQAYKDILERIKNNKYE